METEPVVIKIEGGCHCKKVRFEATCYDSIKVYECNCSICTMKQNHHFIINQNNFKINPESDEFLTSYVFNTK